MNAFGGEDRIWLGPEGGQFSIFFKKGDPFDLAHWQTPALIDSEPWTVAERTARQVFFKRDSKLHNYSGTRFDFRLERTVAARSSARRPRRRSAPSLPAGLKLVAFESQNVLVNTGKSAWTKSSGLLSIWILGMFQPTPRHHRGDPLPPGTRVRARAGRERRLLRQGARRSPAREGRARSSSRATASSAARSAFRRERATGLAASYDAARGVLTVVRYDQPAGRQRTT